MNNYDDYLIVENYLLIDSFELMTREDYYNFTNQKYDNYIAFGELINIKKWYPHIYTIIIDDLIRNEKYNKEHDKFLNFAKEYREQFIKNYVKKNK